MHVVIEVMSGPHIGRRLDLKPGQRGHIGKAAWAELSLPEESVAGIQATFECSHSACTFKVATWDRKILLNGANILDGKHDWKQPLHDQSEITIGSVKLRVHVVDAVDSPIDTPPPTSSKSCDLLGILTAAQPLYAILDAARDQQILGRVQNCCEEYQSLYEEFKAIELAEVSPYLVRLPAGCGFLKELIDNAWGHSWGVYLTCPGSFADVRKHLRHFLKVESNGKPFVFRFYDPRVLRVFLPACNPDELQQFFGPITVYWMESPGGKELLKLSNSPAGLQTELIEFSPRPPLAVQG